MNLNRYLGIAVFRLWRFSANRESLTRQLNRTQNDWLVEKERLVEAIRQLTVDKRTLMENVSNS